ncbi:uncharacterized protein LOC114270858 [Camellia sinensis]|uniref:uncharacterized protein LOC114270858 n=1 Tax=Camellia sinensis TaxID=4442 RepID=UPI0010364D85|nr:uncharacterized protein LOC114270858 [Camellia sinensis]
MDHYLTVCKWEPNFKALEAFKTITTVRVRFPELLIEYYQDKVLFAIAKTIRKPLKLAMTIAMATRGKFAHVCVELDLRKPLCPRFFLEGEYYTIEYESLHAFCFFCGGVDHRKESYRFKPPKPRPEPKQLAVSDEASPSTATDKDNIHPQQPGLNQDEEYGPWMLVTKKNRRPVYIKKTGDPNTAPRPNRFKYLEQTQEENGDHPRG